MDQDTVAAFNLFGLRTTSCWEEVHRRYLELSDKYHPDKYAPGSRERSKADELMKDINVARDTLKQHFAFSTSQTSASADAQSDRSYASDGANRSGVEFKAAPPASVSDVLVDLISHLQNGNFGPQLVVLLSFLPMLFFGVSSCNMFGGLYSPEQFCTMNCDTQYTLATMQQSGYGALSALSRSAEARRDACYDDCKPSPKWPWAIAILAVLCVLFRKQIWEKLSHQTTHSAAQPTAHRR